MSTFSFIAPSKNVVPTRVTTTTISSSSSSSGSDSVSMGDIKSADKKRKANTDLESLQEALDNDVLESNPMDDVLEALHEIGQEFKQSIKELSQAVALLRLVNGNYGQKSIPKTGKSAFIIPSASGKEPNFDRSKKNEKKEEKK